VGLNLLLGWPMLPCILATSLDALLLLLLVPRWACVCVCDGCGASPPAHTRTTVHAQLHPHTRAPHAALSAPPGRHGVRTSEAVTVGLVMAVVGCFMVDLLLSQPPLGAVLRGLLVPRLPADAVYVAVCLLGANVMPHNLILHR
jgi:hypothetical protein